MSGRTVNFPYDFGNNKEKSSGKFSVNLEVFQKSAQPLTSTFVNLEVFKEMMAGFS